MADVICAWCKKLIGKTDAPGTSHGICEECAKRFLEETDNATA